MWFCSLFLNFTPIGRVRQLVNGGVLARSSPYTAIALLRRGQARSTLSIMSSSALPTDLRTLLTLLAKASHRYLKATGCRAVIVGGAAVSFCSQGRNHPAISPRSGLTDGKYASSDICACPRNPQARPWGVRRDHRSRPQYRSTAYAGKACVDCSDARPIRGCRCGIPGS